MVVHKRGNAPLGSIGRGVDVEGGAVGRAPQHDFLTPVAEEVGGQVGCGFGAVAGGGVAVGAQGVAAETEA